MANVYVEARPKGRTEGSAIDDYVVESAADLVLATFKTQREATGSLAVRLISTPSPRFHRSKFAPLIVDQKDP
jgi:hypothetical protein